jgi:hypothetical protein
MRLAFYVTATFYRAPVYFYDDDDPAWTDPPGAEPEEETAGWLDRNKLVIHVKAGSLPAASVADTLLHEALHLAAMAGGGHEGKVDEEAWVTMLTAGLKQLLTEDNDDLLAYLGANL